MNSSSGRDLVKPGVVSVSEALHTRTRISRKTMDKYPTKCQFEK